MTNSLIVAMIATNWAGTVTLELPADPGASPASYVAVQKGEVHRAAKIYFQEGTNLVLYGVSNPILAGYVWRTNGVVGNIFEKVN